MWNLDPGGLEPTRDLPLLSNTGDIRVRHYLINLDVKFRQKIFTGELVIFLEPATEKEKKDGILTSHDSVTSRDFRLEADLGGTPSPTTGVRCTAVEDAKDNGKKKGISEVQAGQNERRSIRENKPLGQDTRNLKDKEKDSAVTSTASENDSAELFTCVLDCCDITVEKVEEVNINSNIQSIISSNEVSLPQSFKYQDIDGPEKHNDNISATLWNDILESETKLSKILGYKRCNYKERNNAFVSCLRLPGESLSFKVDTWSLSIWRTGINRVEDFPAVIRITYSTNANGRSFTWTEDQRGRECVFSQGAWINNRSLFPCQEPPGAMATWQAYIQAPEEYVVLMSGDELAETKVVSSDGTVSSYYFVNMVMPPSMLALAIGQWHGVNLSTDVKNTLGVENTIDITYNHMSGRSTTCIHEPWPCRINLHQQPIIPARIFAPKSVLASAEEELGGCIPGYLNAAFKILGPHPFSRLDIVVLPRCFASIGLASPSIVFISQTLLAGDSSLCSRLAHEISHSWFGLLIGAMDWTEEWLSEGFATFLEDPIQSIAESWTKAQFQEISNLRALLRFRALKAEVENTASELQIMRPMGDQSHVRDALLSGYVKNGQHPDKWFLQVHYLKGYFLLHYIADIVGIESLLHVMSTYVSTFHGRLVLSKQFFEILFDMCPILAENNISQTVIEKDWLDSPGIPNTLNHERFMNGNKLIQQVISEVAKWRAIDSTFGRKDKFKLKKKMKLTFEEPELNLNLLSEQLCLLLEYLLEDESLTSKTLTKLKNDFELHLKNAEIRHRWCELVIRHKFMDGYGDVRMFLLKDQSMGVYLYGELLASEDPIQRLLAETCYEAVAMVMDRGCRKTVEEMMGKL